VHYAKVLYGEKGEKRCCELFSRSGCYIKRKKREKKRKRANYIEKQTAGNAYTAPGNCWEGEGTTSHSTRFKRIHRTI